MKSFSTLVTCAVTYSLLAATSFAQLTVFSQPASIPASLDYGAYSTRTKTLPDAESAIAYDNFILSGPAASYDINAICFEGLYDQAFPANPGEANFLVEIWAHDTNGPDLATNVYSQTLFGGVSGVSDGVVATTDLGYDSPSTATTPGGGDAFHYEAMLPSTVTLATGTQYWLSIQALQTFPNQAPTVDPQWQWHLGAGAGDGFYAQDSILDPVGTADFGLLQFGKDLAFELKAVPEPSTYGLMIAGIFGLGLIRRRR